MISRALVENMFESIREHGKWNLDGPLLWGFFFTDADRKKLESAAADLSALGYAYVDIFPAEDDAAREQPYWFLHVERVEHLTVDSLDERNQQLAAFALERGIDSYDGMDVGPAP